MFDMEYKREKDANGKLVKSSDEERLL